jgi:hypothetical protein
MGRQRYTNHNMELEEIKCRGSIQEKNVFLLLFLIFAFLTLVFQLKAKIKRQSSNIQNTQ